MVSHGFCRRRRLTFFSRVKLDWVLRASAEGNGNPLQYSCLENSMDKGAWWATVRGVTIVRHDRVTNTLRTSELRHWVCVRGRPGGKGGHTRQWEGMPWDLRVWGEECRAGIGFTLALPKICWVTFRNSNTSKIYWAPTTYQELP